VLEIYSYIPTIPLAEALALEARRAGSDTHITLMTDDLWFTSMKELPARWLRAPSPAEEALNRTITARVYLGGPADARRMRDIPPEKFDANATGGFRQGKPLRQRRVREVDLSVGRVTPERAEAYGLDYDAWRRSYEAALAVDLREIQEAGKAWERRLRGKKRVHVSSDSGTSLTFETKTIQPQIDDGIISPLDLRRGFVGTSLPAGKVVAAVIPSSAEGVVHFADPIFYAGRTVRGAEMSFSKGKLTRWSAGENAELMPHLLGPKTAPRFLGWASIGLNPAAQPCMISNDIVKDDVLIGFGPHPELERAKASPGPQFEATIGRCEIQVG
jgi:leucyl aminopeptidase (aminopeptidase T)